jgi:hypothetical protein
MPFALMPYTAEWTAAVSSFNERLQKANAPVDFGLENSPSADRYLVTDGDAVRGGCIVGPERAVVAGSIAEVVSIQSPLSEGLINSEYSACGPWMMQQILRRWPLAYSVGMGSIDRPYPRLLRALRWKIESVPFYFRVLRGDRVIAQMPAMRQKLGPRLVARVPIVPRFAFGFLHRWRGARGKPPEWQIVEAFSDRETQIWNRLQAQLSFAVVRDAPTLNARYPDRAAESIVFARFAHGYFVVKLRRFIDDKYFGSLRVVTWVDGVAEPGEESHLVAAAEAVGRSLGADLLITNQLYAPLQQAIHCRGWLSYPSNFLVAWSPQIGSGLNPAASYLSRRDSDGLIHL